MGFPDPSNRGPYERSPFSGRLIGAIIMMLIGLFMYWTQVQENPVTHEKQHIAITPEQEIHLGLHSAPAMARKMGGELPSTDPRTREVNRIGDLIVSQTTASESPWKFKFHLLADTQTVNAFALPGGQIFITLGLLNKLKTEAQLAGVLSHEIGHVIERHTAQQMAKNQLGNAVISAVGSATSDPEHPSRSYSPTLIATVVNQMIQLRYSRQDESEADIWGIKLMTEAGFDPAAMIQVMEILKASAKSGNMPELFQTHPNPDIRIKQIEDYLQKHPTEANLKEGKSLKEMFHRSVRD